MSLPNLIPYDEILRGRVYNAAIPFVSERPLEFVVKDEKHSDMYRLVTKDYGFEPVKNLETGRQYAPVVKVVTEFKLRPVFVIQNNILNRKESYHAVIVLPISTINEDDKKKSFYKSLINENNHESLHYLGNITGKEAYTTISDPKRIHKNMIFKAKHEISIPDEMLDEILTKFANLFEVKKIAQCEDCDKNCNNCELKRAVNK